MERCECVLVCVVQEKEGKVSISECIGLGVVKECVCVCVVSVSE